ncbi:MAG: hypothetical protein IJQ77_07335 [Synergistaceae bacterium]|nr:hypothetical protein [Synergistaceae bacterium]
MLDNAFYVLDVDHENKVVTLSFAQECFIANNLNELKVLADATGQLSQDLNTLLQSGLQDDNRDADCEAIDLTEIAFLNALDDDKHKHEK